MKCIVCNKEATTKHKLNNYFEDWYCAKHGIELKNKMYGKELKE